MQMSVSGFSVLLQFLFNHCCFVFLLKIIICLDLLKISLLLSPDLLFLLILAHVCKRVQYVQMSTICTLSKRFAVVIALHNFQSPLL